MTLENQTRQEDTYAPSQEDIDRRRKLRVATYSIAAAVAFGTYLSHAGRHFEDIPARECLPIAAASIVGAGGAVRFSRRDRALRGLGGAMVPVLTYAGMLMIEVGVNAMSEIDAWNTRQHNYQPNR